METFVLRDYQEEGLQAIKSALDEGVQRQLVVWPTGLGKTVLFSHLPQVVDGKMLVIAHREELLDQAREKILRANPHLQVDIEQANRHADPDADVVIASVQTIGRKDSTRINKFAPDTFTSVVVDEAHHCHVPGTLIEMPDGNVKHIENVKVSDVVTSSIGPRRVVDTFSYWYDGPLYKITTESGAQVRVTPNHRMYRELHKVPATRLQPGDPLVLSSMWNRGNFSSSLTPASALEASGAEALSGLLGLSSAQRDECASRETPNRTFGVSGVQRDVRVEKHVGTYQHATQQQLGQRSRSACSCDESAIEEHELSATSLREDAWREEPDGRSRNTREDAHLIGADVREQDRRFSQVRQRETPHPFGGVHTEALPRCSPPGGDSRRRRATVSLQIRSRMEGETDRTRDRRFISQSSRKTRSRSSQGRTFGRDRLGDSQGDSRTGVLSRDRIVSIEVSHYSGWVYDFEVEEAHNYFANRLLSSNSAATTYRRVLDYFEDCRLRLGVTATPQRGDKTRLTDVFEEITHFRTIKDGIEAGWLAELVGYRVPTNVDISGVTTRRGDYAEKELAEAVNVDERNWLAVEVYQELAPDKKTLVYCVDVAHTHAMAEAFRRAGIPTGALDGSMSNDERSRVLDDFRSGKTPVLVNCMILTEGFDDPGIEAIILARPTKSQLLYTQIVGRGTRLDSVQAPQKDHCLIIDLADATKNKKPIGLPTLMGLPPDFDTEGKALTEVAALYAELEEAAPAEAAKARSVKDIEEAWERIDMFTPEPIDPELQEYSSLVWMEVGNDRYLLRLNNGERLTITGDALGQYTVTLKRTDGLHTMGVCETMEEAFRRSDRWIQKYRSEQMKLLDNDAPWRQLPPTEKQLKYLRKNKIPITNELNRGDASRILDEIFAKQPKKKRPAWVERKIQAQKRGY